MGILKVIRPIKLNGEVLQPGEMFRTQDGQLLIDRGYARPLTEEEIRSILKEYVQEAERVFAAKPAGPCRIKVRR